MEVGASTLGQEFAAMSLWEGGQTTDDINPTDRSRSRLEGMVPAGG